MALAKKQSEELIFDNRLGIAVDDILSDDGANKAFRKIEGNVAGLEWEAEILESEVHILRIHNNQYAALAEDDDNGEEEHGNYEKSKGGKQRRMHGSEIRSRNYWSG